MSRGPEFALLAAHPLGSMAGARTLSQVLALCALGYDARGYDVSAGAFEAGALRGARAIVYDMTEMPGGARLELARSATALTACSEALAAQASEALGRPVHYVPDIAEGAAGEPRAARARPRSRPLDWLARRAGLTTDAWRLRLLWSGEAADVEALANAYSNLLSLELPLELRCLATAEILGQLGIQEDRPEAVRLALQAWSPAAMAEALADCDFVLLPATGARLLAAVHAGRLALAQPGAQYGKLGEFAWLGEAAEGLRWALGRPREALERLRRGQEYIGQVHAPGAVAQAWIRIVTKGPQ